MNKAYLVMNISTISNSITLQVNKRDMDGTCYNLTFIKHPEYLVLEGFMIPTFTGNYNLPINGNPDTRALLHCLKTLPKVQENKTNILDFVADIIKREKLNHYQINVNGNMDYSNARPIGLTAVVEMSKAITSLNFPIEF